MKVLMIAPTPFFSNRGCHVRIRGEAEALQSLDHSVKIVTYHHGDDVPGLDVDRTLSVPWYTKREAGPSIHKFYTDLLLQLKTLRVAGSFSPDVIHAHLHEGIIAGWFTRQLFDVPLVFDFQGSLTEELVDHGVLTRDSNLFGLTERIERLCYWMADRIFLSSSTGQDVFEERFPAYRDKSVLMPDAVRLDSFDPPLSRPGEVPELPEAERLVVYTGILSEYQGIDLLLQGVPEVVAEQPGVHFLVVGYPDVEIYRKKAIELGVDEYVTFTGEVPYDAIPYYLSRADIAISPKLSRSEGNLKLTDYMAAGLPSVVFANPVNRSLLGEAGHYVDEESPTSFAKGIIEVLSDDSLAEELAKKAKRRAKDQFSWEARGKEIVKEYRELLEG